MNNIQSENHAVRGGCKYHLVWIPKYPKTVLYDHLRKDFRDISEIWSATERDKLSQGT